MEEEIYKKLYYRAFNCLTELNEEIQTMQHDLEELYIQLQEKKEQEATDK